MHCGCKYTPEPKQPGYPNEMRKQAVEMYVNGMNLHHIARHLGIQHRTVSLRVKASAASITQIPLPEEVQATEMDELFTYISHYKTGSTFSCS